MTIGNFDGIHRGHHALLDYLIEKAHSSQSSAGLILFEPHPTEFFFGKEAPARLMSLKEKEQMLRKWAIDKLLCLKFDDAFSKLSPEAFVNQILLQNFNLEGIIIGQEFRFGYQRQGDSASLSALGEQYGFWVETVAPILSDEAKGIKVSSSQVRVALKSSDFKTATQLLGRPFSIEGRVETGQKLARTLGFPTANIALDRLVSPLTGVFLVRVALESGAWKFGVANIGHRPTVGGTQHRLEVHLLNFEGMLYGMHLKVEFLKKLREEQKFPSIDHLKNQIIQDIAYARTLIP